MRDQECSEDRLSVLMYVLFFWLATPIGAGVALFAYANEFDRTVSGGATVLLGIVLAYLVGPWLGILVARIRGSRQHLTAGLIFASVNLLIPVLALASLIAGG